MTDLSQSNWLQSQDPESGYPDAIPLTLTEDELVSLQQLLEARSPGSPLQRKLRAAQAEAFARAHG